MNDRGDRKESGIQCTMLLKAIYSSVKLAVIISVSTIILLFYRL